MRHSHHIGCLAALAKAATDRGYYVFIASSGPHTKAVAPYGGRAGLFSPNPFAIGFPTRDAPVLVDISASLTTISNVRERTARKQPSTMPGSWTAPARRRAIRPSSSAPPTVAA